MGFRVGCALPTDAPPIFDALLEVRDGRIALLGPWPVHKPPPQYQDRRDWGLLSGLVNAHCHLELSCLRAAIPPTPDFIAWLRQLMQLAPNYSPQQREAAIAEGLAELADSGTTSIWDIANSELALPLYARSGLRVAWFRELLGQRWTARAAAWKAARAAWTRWPDTETRTAHVSPHAPYTAHPRLIARAARWAAGAGKQWGIHLAESPEEQDLLLTGSGPMRAFLGPFLPRGWKAPGMRALAYLAGLPWPRERPPLVFHANLLDAEEWDLAARLGVAVVHCPGSHEYFRRPPFPAAEFLSRGIPVLLGTDSLASNARLDMRREVRLFAASQPQISREKAFRMASRDAAAFLSGRGRPVGLAVGAPADLWFWRLPDGPPGPGPAEPLLERLLEAPHVESQVWVGGQPVPVRKNLGISPESTG